MSAKQYKKRPGTSGIQGQLYETKLISLINFRALHDDTVESFHLATNMDAIGTFDDICLRAKVSDFDKPLVLFIQAKHRENDKLFTFNSNNDLTKCFDSYLRIKGSFNPANQSPIFGGKFEDVECFFVMYTNAKMMIDENENKKEDNTIELKYQGEFADYLNELIGTGDACVQPIYDNDQVDFLCKIVMKEEVTSLAQNIAKFITKQTNTELSMNNDVMLRYHVLLAQHVWDVSEIQTEGHRIVHFKENFFDSSEEFIALFKNVLCLEVLKKKKTELNEVISLLSEFFDRPDEVSLSQLIGNVITYENGKLEFISKSTDDDLKRQLDEVNVSQTVVFKAAVIGAKQYLQTLKLKVPACFGNKDLTVRGFSDDKINQRLLHLTTEFVKILNKAETGKVVTIDERSFDKGLLKLNGGLASAVGNILVLDKDTGYLKFTDDFESLGSIAKRWYEQLNRKIKNLGEYKLDVKVKNFPKLTFLRGEHDASLVRDFCNKLLLFTNQSNHSAVEDILIREIEDHPNNKHGNVHNFKVRSDVIYLRYHDEIQKLWTTQKVGSYLTKDSKIYINAVTKAMNEPLIDVLNTMHKINYKDFEFKEESLRAFEKYDVIGAIIESGSPKLMAVKLEQYLRKEYHTVLELEQIFKLPFKSHTTFCRELTNCKDRILIFLSNHIQSSNNDDLARITKAVKDKPIVIVADKPSVETIKNHFSQVNRIINDITISLVDLTDESQRKVLRTAKAKLQGLDVSLDLIIDEDSAEFVDDTSINNIIDGKTIEIGQTLTNSSYENIKKFYIDRTVTKKVPRNIQDKVEVMVQTLYDTPNDVVLIKAIPGMGKSTLMTHLSLKTKDVYPMVWILRINLLEHTKILSDWKDCHKDINMLESLRFMCDVAIRKKREDFNEDDEMKIELQEELGKIVLKNWNGDSFIEFQLKLFLYYYNTQKLIFIFDGFDEIFPHYADQALALVKSVRDFYRKRKIWITTRSFTNSQLVLENEFGLSYEIKDLTQIEQQNSLFKFWDTKLQLTKLDRDQRHNINELIQFFFSRFLTAGFKCDHHNNILSNVYATFLRYLKTKPKIADVDYSYSEDKFNNCYFNHGGTTSDGFSFNCSPHPIDKPTPLHLYLLAEYILSKIKKYDKNENKWDINITNCSFYEYYIENKVKIKFQEKNKIDIYTPDNRDAYEKEKVECINKHKKLGFYASIHDHLEFLEETELEEMKALVEEVNDELNTGKEKIGFIRTVANDLPIFVHQSFAEYFAVVYICDRIKNKSYHTVEEKYKLIEIIKVMFQDTSVYIVFKGKCDTDPQFFEILNRNHPLIIYLMNDMKSCFDEFEDDGTDHPIQELLCKIVDLTTRRTEPRGFCPEKCNKIFPSYKRNLVSRLNLSIEFDWYHFLYISGPAVFRKRRRYTYPETELALLINACGSDSFDH